MTPADRAVISDDVAVLAARADDFAREFYATLFDLDPSTRRLFDDDIEAQRTKLFDELSVLVDRATSVGTPQELSGFADRAGRLGERHEVYGVTAPMYDVVGVALLAALRTTVDDFDGEHEVAWTRLYRLVAASMQQH